MPYHNEFTWKLESPIVDKTNSPTTLFQKFFTDDILEQIRIESIKHAKFKGSHNFNVDVNTLKTFITVLLISVYVDLKRRPMFWENIVNAKS